MTLPVVCSHVVQCVVQVWFRLYTVLLAPCVTRLSVCVLLAAAAAAAAGSEMMDELNRVWRLAVCWCGEHGQVATKTPVLVSRV